MAINVNYNISNNNNIHHNNNIDIQVNEDEHFCIAKKHGINMYI